MQGKKLFIAFVLAALACTGNASATDATATRIVIGAHPTAIEKFAAEELQSYLHDITGAPAMPILSASDSLGPTAGCEVLIGRAETNSRLAIVEESAHFHLDPATLGCDGYIIKTVPSDTGTALMLTGVEDRSCLFATYDFLEHRGVRFFGYRARGGEVVPRDVIFTVQGLDILQKPAMKYRFVSDNGFGTTDRAKMLNVADWAAKNRHNVIMVTPSRPGESWGQVPIDELKKRGLLIAGPGHALPQMTPKVELFAEHPEYFPLIKGRRATTFSKSWGGSTGFCSSNPHAMQTVVENAVKYVQDNPFIDILAIYPADGSQRGSQCQCDECKKHTASEWYLTTLNNIAQAVEKQRPDLKIMWLSYNECGVPPRNVKPYNHGRNFVLVWCNDIRDLHEPMDSDANRRAAPELKWKPALRRIKTDWMENPTDADLAAYHRWRGWAEFLRNAAYEGDTTVLEYYNAHVAKSLHIHWLNYCQSGPWPNNLMQRDFQFYLSQGIVGWQNCTDYYNDQPNPYWNRLMAQMLWDPSADRSVIDSDFYSKFYGLAGSFMQEYFTALWQELSNDAITPEGLQRLQNLDSLLGKAEETMRDPSNSEFAARIKAARAFQNHCVLLRRQVQDQYNADGSPKLETGKKSKS